MAKKKAVRRENGRGTVEKTSNKKNPFRAKVSVGTKPDKNRKIQAVYKALFQIFMRHGLKGILPL